MNDKILVLGASSILGRRFCEKLPLSRVVGTFYKSKFENGLYFDAVRMDLNDIVSKLSAFSHALILFAESDPDECARERNYSYSLNVTATKKILDQLVASNVHPIFISTEVVFDGAQAPYCEEDVTSPLMTYGKQKLEIENYITQTRLPHTIIRLSRMYGDDPGDGTLFMDWLKQITFCSHIRCANDQRFSPIFIDDVANALIEIIDKSLTGVFHMGGPRSVSRLEMLNCIIAACGEYEKIDTKVHPCSIKSFSFEEPRPSDVALVSDKLQGQLVTRFRNIEEMCAEFALQWHRRKKCSGG